MGPLGVWELLIILFIIILIFGASRLPQIFGGVGKGIKEFKHAMKDEDTPPTGGTPPRRD
ncbi:MAG TPA: twin-arginine translocase TatA/TatE family subunit [Vicinamibacterales bacterium]|nr:twin-arginine translocase TatA/TatE family subunit [Vicinamibacterales bacterium]